MTVEIALVLSFLATAMVVSIIILASIFVLASRVMAAVPTLRGGTPSNQVYESSWSEEDTT